MAVSEAYFSSPNSPAAKFLISNFQNLPAGFQTVRGFSASAPASTPTTTALLMTALMQSYIVGVTCNRYVLSTTIPVSATSTRYFMLLQNSGYSTLTTATDPFTGLTPSSQTNTTLTYSTVTSIYSLSLSENATIVSGNATNNMTVVAGENIVITITLRSITAVVPAVTYTATKEYIPYITEVVSASSLITRYPINISVNTTVTNVAALYASGEY